MRDVGVRGFNCPFWFLGLGFLVPALGEGFNIAPLCRRDKQHKHHKPKTLNPKPRKVGAKVAPTRPRPSDAPRLQEFEECCHYSASQRVTRLRGC